MVDVSARFVPAKAQPQRSEISEGKLCVTFGSAGVQLPSQYQHFYTMQMPIQPNAMLSLQAVVRVNSLTTAGI